MRIVKQTCQYCEKKVRIGQFMYDANLGQICTKCYIQYLELNFPKRQSVINHLKREVGIEKRETDNKDKKKELKKWTEKLRQAHKNNDSIKRRRNLRIKRDYAAEALREG